jgi:sensor domain CHASE-containing protein
LSKKDLCMPSDTPASLISRRTTALVVAVLAAPLALAIFFGLWAATSIDAHRLEQEKRLASAGLQETLDRIAVEQNTSAIWDDSVIEVRARNDDWLAENLVEWVSDYFGHDRVFVIDQFDEVVRAAVRGELADDTEFSADAQIYRPLIQQLRGDMAEVSAGQSNSTDFVSGLGLLDLREMSDGSVGAISIRPIVPSSDRVHLGGPPGRVPHGRNWKQVYARRSCLHPSLSRGGRTACHRSDGQCPWLSVLDLR